MEKEMSCETPNTLSMWSTKTANKEQPLCCQATVLEIRFQVTATSLPTEEASSAVLFSTRGVPSPASAREMGRSRARAARPMVVASVKGMQNHIMPPIR